MISLFAYIVTLGLVVDDAIVVGENIFEKREKGLPWIEAAVEGAREMAVPVTFAVLTSVAAFSPLLLVPGVSGKVFWSDSDGGHFSTSAVIGRVFLCSTGSLRTHVG